MYEFELCASRHMTPATGRAIFGNTVDPTDVAGLRAAAEAAIPADAAEINLYVTGLSVALLAVVAVCESRMISLTAYHFDRETGDFYPQQVLRYERCPFCGQPFNHAHGAFCPACGSN